MKDSVPSILFRIIAELQEARIAHSLHVNRDNAVTILAAVPGQRWEIDVFVDDNVELEVFISGGEIAGVDTLTEMIEKYAN